MIVEIEFIPINRLLSAALREPLSMVRWIISEGSAQMSRTLPFLDIKVFHFYAINPPEYRRRGFKF